jgi:hypothetical protein
MIERRQLERKLNTKPSLMLASGQKTSARIGTEEKNSANVARENGSTRAWNQFKKGIKMM